jgi:hypothetical protein
LLAFCLGAVVARADPADSSTLGHGDSSPSDSSDGDDLSGVRSRSLDSRARAPFRVAMMNDLLDELIVSQRAGKLE